MLVLTIPNTKVLYLQVCAVPNTLEQLVQNALKKFEATSCVGRLYTISGGEIDDIELIRDDEMLVVCIDGQSFQPIPNLSFHTCPMRHNAYQAQNNAAFSPNKWLVESIQLAYDSLRLLVVMFASIVSSNYYTPYIPV